MFELLVTTRGRNAGTACAVILCSRRQIVFNDENVRVNAKDDATFMLLEIHMLAKADTRCIVQFWRMCIVPAASKLPYALALV
jgi:hypothetical protein